MKWRFLLSVASVVLALFLWRVGLWEYLSMIQQHHHGKHYHVPLAQAVSYTINSPALVLSNFVDNLLVRDLDWDERWLHYGTIEYYISVFALWWCIGSRIDRKPGPLKHTILWSIACFIGICFSLLLVYGGIMVREIEIEYETTAVPISMVLWGLGLSLYFGKELRQLYVLRVRRA